MKEPINSIKISLPENQIVNMEKTIKDLKACSWAIDLQLFSGEEVQIEIN